MKSTPHESSSGGENTPGLTSISIQSSKAYFLVRVGDMEACLRGLSLSLDSLDRLAVLCESVFWTAPVPLPVSAANEWANSARPGNSGTGVTVLITLAEATGLVVMGFVVVGMDGLPQLAIFQKVKNSSTPAQNARKWLKKGKR